MGDNVEGLPVAGYKPQSSEKIDLVNGFKQDEERLIRLIESMFHARDVGTNKDGILNSDLGPTFDPRWLSIALNHFQQGYMALNRAVFRPGRVKLEEDE